MRLHDRLRAHYADVSGRCLRQWLAAGRITVNGTVVRRGDVEVAAEDRVRLGAPPPPAMPPPLRLVHEDGDIIVVDKPPGLLTIATERERERTAYRLVTSYVQARRPEARVFIVHRLDRETSGLVCFARSWSAKRSLQGQFEARTAERIYVAIVEGAMASERGTLTARVAETRAPRVRTVEGARRGREAITRYRVLARGTDTTVIELRLVTGRRGQIRAQLAALGHPIVGDAAYGSRRNPVRRVCLHATRLALVHPSGSGGRVTFESPMPPSFRRVV